MIIKIDISKKTIWIVSLLLLVGLVVGSTTIGSDSIVTTGEVNATQISGVIIASEYATLQTAINVSAGKKVFIPAGRYIIDRPLFLFNKTKLIGAGNQETIIVPSATFSGDAVILRSQEIDDNAIQFDITLRDLKVDCENNANIGIYFNRTLGIKIDNIKVWNCNLYGIHLDDDIYYSTILNTETRFNDDVGIVISDNEVTIVDSWIRDYEHLGVVLDGHRGSDRTVIDTLRITNTAFEEIQPNKEGKTALTINATRVDLTGNRYENYVTGINISEESSRIKISGGGFYVISGQNILDYASDTIIWNGDLYRYGDALNISDEDGDLFTIGSFKTHNSLYFSRTNGTQMGVITTDNEGLMFRDMDDDTQIWLQRDELFFGRSDETTTMNVRGNFTWNYYDTTGSAICGYHSNGSLGCATDANGVRFGA